MPWIRYLTIPLLAAVAMPIAQAADGVDQASVAEARTIVQGFMSELKQALGKAIDEGGAEHAIGVCRAAAPEIAGEMSSESGWAVGRTALRVRNPGNAPSPGERAVLLRFEERAAAGEDLTRMEHVTIGGADGSRYLHYMKAIPTGEMCITCHGSDVEPALSDTIRAAYPQDAATGFVVGKLRGAFTLVKPLVSE